MIITSGEKRCQRANRSHVYEFYVYRLNVYQIVNILYEVLKSTEIALDKYQ